MHDRLICFIGIDGSGKSTASKILMKMLEDLGIKCHIVWGAYDLWFLRPIIRTAKHFFLKNPSPYTNYSEYSNEMKKTSGKKKLLRVYKFLVFCEYWLEIFIKVRVPLLIGRTVICDRYVFDTIINICSNIGVTMAEFRATLTRWMRFFPEPGLIVYFNVPPEVSIARKNDIPNIEYVRKRQIYYKDLSKFLPVIEINGTLRIEEIEKKLKLLVNYLHKP